MKQPRHKPRPASSPPNRSPAAPKAGGASASKSRLRQWALRLALVVLSPLAVFAVVEGALRLSGAGCPASFFSRREANGQGVLVENPRFSRLFFGPALARTPWPFQIPDSKSPATVRLFVLGESAAFGDPLPEFGLARMLQVLLEGRYPGARFEVVNAALTGVNSHALLPIARDCARHQGDVWVIYMGNNEVIGPYGAGTVFGLQVPPLPMIRGSIAVKSTRAGQMLDALWQRLGPKQASRKEWEGMKMFVGQQVGPGDARLGGVYGHFRRNLADLLRAGLDRRARIVLSTVAVNLRDCAPFASVSAPALGQTQRREWERLFRAGCDARQAGQAQKAAEHFEEAARIDAHFAELQFRWGQCCLELGQAAEARRHFALARDDDALRFRADSRLNQIIRSLGQGREPEGIFLADAEEELARQSPHGVPGRECFWEHVHLTFEGNYRLGVAIAEQVARALTEQVARTAGPSRAWMSASECAERLVHGDRHRYEAAASMLMRINEPPFAQQLNHAEQFGFLQSMLEQSLPALQPPALRESVEGCRRALARTPEDWVLWQQQARLLERLGDQPEAVEAWRRVVSLLPYSAPARCGHAAALARQRRFDDALGEYRAAARLAPGSGEVLNGMALTLVLQDRLPDALEVLRRHLKDRPDSPEAHLNLGLTLRTAKNLPEATPHFRFAFEHRPSDPGFLNRLGKACVSLGWTNEAVTAWSEALRLHPTDAPTHLSLGVLLAGMGQFPAALEHYASAVRYQPSLEEARFRLGVELGRQGQHNAAGEQFAAAVELKPDFLQARLNLGMVRARQQRAAEAVKEFQEALRLDPGNATARQHLEALQNPAPPRP